LGLCSPSRAGLYGARVLKAIFPLSRNCFTFAGPLNLLHLRLHPPPRKPHDSPPSYSVSGVNLFLPSFVTSCYMFATRRRRNTVSRSYSDPSLSSYLFPLFLIFIMTKCSFEIGFYLIDLGPPLTREGPAIAVHLINLVRPFFPDDFNSDSVLSSV